MNDKHYENYNPRAAALAEARSLLAAAAQAAMDAGDLPAAELPAFIVEVPADTKTATSPPTSPWPAPAPGIKPPN